MIRVGFEPTPFRTSALSWRLRPLGHLTNNDILVHYIPHMYLDGDTASIGSYDAQSIGAIVEVISISRFIKLLYKL